MKEWNDEIIFLRKLVAGSTNRSYGIQVARLAGIPDTVINRAKTVLARVESGDHLIKNKALNPGKKKSSAQTQLSLFRKPEEVILEKLINLDISTMTPLDAINYLNDLKQQADRF